MIQTLFKVLIELTSAFEMLFPICNEMKYTIKICKWKIILVNVVFSLFRLPISDFDYYFFGQFLYITISNTLCSGQFV